MQGIELPPKMVTLVNQMETKYPSEIFTLINQMQGIKLPLEIVILINYYFNRIRSRFSKVKREMVQAFIIIHFNDLLLFDEYLNLNCAECDHCAMCINCYYCYGCINCRQCTFCYGSNSIFFSEKCHFCQKCNYCFNCFGIIGKDQGFYLIIQF